MFSSGAEFTTEGSQRAMSFTYCETVYTGEVELWQSGPILDLGI